MPMDAKQAKWEERKKKALEELCPMDDILFRCMARDNLPLVQRITRTVLRNPTAEVVRFETQADMKFVGGPRSICLDVWVRTRRPRVDEKRPSKNDSAENKPPEAVVDLELENKRERASPRRARFHASVLDVKLLKESQDFDELIEVWTIFITREDYFRRGKAFYRVERMVLDEEDEASAQMFHDGSHIMYVNGEYKDTDGKYSEIAWLVHDLNTSDWKAMHFPEMADAMAEAKEQKGAKYDMIKTPFEEFLDEYAADAVEAAVPVAVAADHRAIAMEMIQDGQLSFDKIANFARLPLQEVEALARQTAGA